MVGLDIALLGQRTLAEAAHPEVAGLVTRLTCRVVEGVGPGAPELLLLLLPGLVHVGGEGVLGEREDPVVDLFFFTELDLVLQSELLWQVDQLVSRDVALLLLGPPEQERPDERVHPLLALR